MLKFFEYLKSLFSKPEPIARNGFFCHHCKEDFSKDVLAIPTGMGTCMFTCSYCGSVTEFDMLQEPPSVIRHVSKYPKALR